jgi:hypothetical protein
VTRRDRSRIVRIALVVTLFAWGLMSGISAGSQYQQETDSPFSDLSMVVVAVLIFASLLLALAPLTRDLARMVGLSAVAFTVAVLLGHLVGNRGPGGPEVPRGVGGDAGGDSGGGRGGGGGRRR